MHDFHYINERPSKRLTRGSVPCIGTWDGHITPLRGVTHNEEFLEDQDDAKDDATDWDVSMDVRNEQSPKSHIVDKNNEFSSEGEEDKIGFRQRDCGD